jgi:ribosomal protein S18 acetylase RimI-like enzyme
VGRHAPHAPRSLVLATDLDVLPVDRVVERRDGYLAVRSPRNPTHHWGTLLLFDDPPGPGDGARWEALFEKEFAREPRVRHRTFTWDRVDGAAGAVRSELVDRGYELDESIGLVATATGVRPHPRASREVTVRALDPAEGADECLWAAVVELEVITREPQYAEEPFRAFSRARLDGLREHFTAGRGSWYAALDATSGELAASCGIVVTGGRGRFQSVVTAPERRRRGICSRLVVDAARDAVGRFDATRLVIVADLHYHALGLYESLGFARSEHVVGVSRPPERGA